MVVCLTIGEFYTKKGKLRENPEFYGWECFLFFLSEFYFWGLFGFITSLQLIASNKKANFFASVKGISSMQLLNWNERWAGLLRKRLFAALLSSWVVSLGVTISDGWSLMKFGCFLGVVTGVLFFLLCFPDHLLWGCFLHLVKNKENN